MTPVEELREAARLMRERAEQCGSFRDPWRFERTDNEWPTVGRISTADDDPHGLIASLWPSAECGEYMASMHPAVALAVADWLDESAGILGEHIPMWTAPSRSVDDPPAVAWNNPKRLAELAEHHFGRALAVARAYLGGDRG